ncbi:MAG TPA: BON domain-containing protein [Acidimicrobiales bacterium]|jgi:osmotically-inducible protein OsmY|nr:BON domain-containing protein [Acidimicrobiales bacterium]
MDPLDPNAPADYLVGHIEEALARDPRVNEQGLHVTVTGGRVLVDGTVSTPARHEAVAAVVAELLPGWTVSNQADVADYPEPEAEAMEALS